MNENSNSNSIHDEQEVLMARLEELEARLAEKIQEKEEVHLELERYEMEFAQGEKMIQFLRKVKQNLRSSLRAVPAYLLGRRNIKRLYSKAYKQKSAENKLKMHKNYLYDLGFEERARKELQGLFFTTEDSYLKRAVAWELGLFYANKLEKRTADLAVDFLESAYGSDKDSNRKRKLAILQAESYERLEQPEKAKKLLTDLLKENEHPDIHIGLANTEETPEKRLEWINQALQYYGLQEMILNDEDKEPYYRLTTAPIQKELTDVPKVSVIIPAYNAESGIGVAIESLLLQTWKNLELLVVDDCSTDRTQEVVRDYMKSDERVKLFQTPENSGPYVARNIGLKQATGEFVTINDADDWSHPEKLEKQAEYLMSHPEVIANTSAHARLMENLKPYRRSMPGTYIFSNMSSLMFRREQVMEKVGYWDEVRFAADSEFKNRLIAVFGADTVVDLDSGPLSFPMQSSESLTASSTFGYNGFLMGARKEYRESYGFYHKHAESLYMPFQPKDRLFPVPHPMKPNRGKGARKLDVVVISDFRKTPPSYLTKQLSELTKIGMQVGLVQMGTYDLNAKTAIDPTIRNMIDGKSIQMLVYGEHINCDLLFIHNPAIFNEKQKYIPNVKPKTVRVILTELPTMKIGNKNVTYYNLRRCARNIDGFLKVKSKWYPIDEEFRENLQENHRRELQSISMSTMSWLEETENTSSFKNLILGLLTEDNSFRME